MKCFGMILVLFSTSLVAADLEHLSGLKGSEYRLLHSQVLDHDYHIYVKTPVQTKKEKFKKWPVLYLLDGGNTFPMFTPYMDYLVWAEDLQPMIVVGISYGSNDWQKGNKRGTDFTLPADGQAHYGGAEKFHQFLTTELIPLIENKYPADSEKRILFGHSLGGQFVIYCAMFQPQTFNSLIASNPAIHRNTDSFLVDVASTKFRPNLFILQADNDNEEYQTPRQQWLDYWQDKAHHWNQQVMTAKGHNHMSSLPTAFRQGMMWLFPKTKEQQNQP